MKKIVKSLMLTLLIVPITVFAHGGKKHEEINATLTPVLVSIDKKQTAVFKAINKVYLKEVKPIFKVKCFDCHGTIESYPWYYKVPGIKQLMDWDMEESKEHLDMRKDFPFVSHESPLEDLKSLKEVIEEDDMPPIQYVLGHWDSYLTKLEKEKVYEWVDGSIKKLGDTK